MEQQLEDVIAERTLEARRPGSDAVVAVRVRVGRPMPDPDPEGDWICPVQILGLGNEAVANVFGVDAVQALMLAMQKIGVDLQAAARSGVDLRWLEGADLGFPLPPGVFRPLAPG